MESCGSKSTRGLPSAPSKPTTSAPRSSTPATRTSIRAGVIQHPRNVAAAIKAGAGRTAAPHIRVADVLGCFLHHGGKLIIFEGFRWNVVIGGLLDGGCIGVLRFAKQIRPVAQCAHIERISTELFFGQHFHGQETDVMENPGASCFSTFLRNVTSMQSPLFFTFPCSS